MVQKVAVVLLNLGGPGSLGEVERFLFSLFSDRRIIGLPGPIRAIAAKLASMLRAKSSREIYKLIGGKSPILAENNLQASALEKKLKDESNSTVYKVFVCMRHSEPSSAKVLEEVNRYQPERVVLLPLYPQYSSTTTLSSIEDWYKNASKIGYKFNTDIICCYYNHKHYISAHCESILQEYRKALHVHKNPRLLFSAHSLPVRTIQRGDPYQDHVTQNVSLILKELGTPYVDYSICYQSKIGPVKWLEPSTKSEIIRANNDGVPVVVVPISFVSENSETLAELDIEYRALLREDHYFRVPALGTHELFIECLRDLSRKPQTERECNCSQYKLYWKNFILGS